MNLLITCVKNSIKINVRYMSHSHYISTNYEILYKKIKDLLYQQHITNNFINEMEKKLVKLENKIVKLEQNKKKNK